DRFRPTSMPYLCRSDDFDTPAHRVVGVLHVVLRRNARKAPIGHRLPIASTNHKGSNDSARRWMKLGVMLPLGCPEWDRSVAYDEPEAISLAGHFCRHGPAICQDARAAQPFRDL